MSSSHDATSARPRRADRDAAASTPSPLRLYAAADDAEPVLITRSPRLLAVLEQARRVAPTRATVLIEGETGTGKELVAQFIHVHSRRAGHAFLRVNCAALSETLIESELFGHERGAFTGAEQAHAGRFERAHGGTLLLDEVGELPLKLQAKLLRVLEQAEFERVGGEKTLAVDVRVLATTNRDLAGESAHGHFRPDLYYRLSTIHLAVPALRARPEDIAPLVAHFIERFAPEGEGRVGSLSGPALALLAAHSWPGNVRQLRNIIHGACILAQGARIEVDDLPPLREAGAAPAPTSGQTLAEIERRVILDTLRQLGGNKTAAAQRLGVTARTLLNKLKKYREADAA
jgi:DNA-binding NtrC family response regulator